MIRPVVGWFRLVLPPRWTLGLLAAFILINEAVYFAFQPLGPEWLRVRDAGVLFASAAYGVFRVQAFHPLYRASYGRWLALTPWTSAKPLPVGPIHLVPQDACLGALVWLLHDPQVSLWRFPLVFLVCYLLVLCCTLVGSGLAIAVAVNFGLGLVVRLWYDPPLALAIAAVVYCVGYAGLRRSLDRFPWTIDAGWQNATAQIQTAAAQAQDPAGQEIASGVQFSYLLGWPLDQLLPTFEPAIAVAQGTVLSLLTGWWGYVILSLIDLPQAREAVAFFFEAVGYLVAVSRLVVYCGKYRPPIGFWGRIWTFHWIIPGYDLIFVVPVLAVIAAQQAHQVLQNAGAAPEIRAPISVALAMLLTLNLGPTFRTWRLTGRHRIVSGKLNKQWFVRL